MLLETTRGDIVIDLYTESSPKTCMNFVKLCKLRYYDSNLIFNVVRNFAFTTGDGESAARDGSAAGCSVHGLLYGEQVRVHWMELRHAFRDCMSISWIEILPYLTHRAPDIRARPTFAHLNDANAHRLGTSRGRSTS